MTQQQWRFMGAVTLIIASSMAAFAVLSDVLRNSVVAIIAIFSSQVAEEAQPFQRWPLIAFWLIFASMISATLYFAMIDIRHIRLQYRTERREILKRTLQEEGFRESLRERTAPGERQKASRNGR